MLRRLLLSLCLVALLPVAGFCAEKEKSAKDDKKTDAKATIGVFSLSSGVSETPADDNFGFGEPGVSLKDLVARLQKAGKDPALKAVVLLPGSGIGRAQLEEIRQAIGQLREAGKDVFVHADSMSMGQYILAAGATRISLVPTSDLWLTGLYGESPYVRGLLDKIGVKPDFLHCGAYKSASETFMREGPSKEAEEMQNWLLDSSYETVVKLIAKGRGVEADKVKKWIDNGPYTAEKAKTAGLIDAVEQKQDFEAMLKSKYGKNLVFNRKYGQKLAPKIDLSSPFAVFKIMGDLLNESQKKKSGKDAIAIIYVDGAISLGSSKVSLLGSTGGAYSSDLRKALDEAARDNTIKAVILRVDSPGGSAVASDIILDATKRVKAKKPFVVSMGNVAGSGGYYVACGSDLIFADEATITGSIGVVGGKIATNDAWKKIGITFKAYKRGENAAILSSADVFSKEEKVKMQAWMDDIYGVFKGHVTASRGDRLKKPIDDLAGGRVYTGRQALELGLVDKIGTLQDTIKHIADKAKLTDYEVRVVPEPKNLIEKFLEEASGDKDDADLRLTSHSLAKGSSASIMELALPYMKHLDPNRVTLILAALQRLQLIQKEGAVLMMPEMRVGD